ncbi:MAG: hypothetical protein JWO66_2652 [Candidatus Eremiobacteraeota bacterium]|nr:hypothetical protein [Candidatus Eremiobacteraeota bacterium]
MHVMPSKSEALANLLAEAERAGGRTLLDLMLEEDAPEELREVLRKLAHDEGYWARRLDSYVRSGGGSPSGVTGDFAQKVRAVSGLREKLVLLNRGQRWVIRTIDQHLASVDDPELRGILYAMAQSHHANVRLVDENLALLPASTAGHDGCGPE